MTSAKAIYDQLTSYESIVALIDDQATETTYLDFKVCSREGRGGRRERQDLSDDEIKAIWSKAISGFANTGGGVIVWGINAPEHVATETAPHSDALQLAGRLQALVSRATDPPLTGVECRHILVKEGEPVGFVVAHIPAGADCPYEAQWGKGRCYYIRAGDSFVPASRPILQRLFYPQRHVRLVPYLQFSRFEQWHGKRRTLGYSVQLYLANEGTSTADDVHVRILRYNQLYCNVLQPKAGSVWEDMHQNWRRSKFPIHAGRDVVLTHQPFQVELRVVHNTAEMDRSPTEPISIQLQVFARDAAAVECTIELSQDFIKERLIRDKPVRVPFPRQEIR